ncbi:RNase H domain protein [Aspergillus fischeri NRRL 181]|uniref:ribonuclease H n=1 Tax=Neosartorya fischeri (strain ATCC 1020 / DSM 3700 / CBS 544.65 / FGSC A1164 / JCM 1740 / NRRL 181 / WB 181) TaxID=331117 RepID=A1D7S4_NEOFI|nr:RNase H domain protein [Aspergillus fischeri NRRL 181]EAW21768.1 RNase H domain protein [Aspergillus fischeri NRRL 181]
MVHSSHQTLDSDDDFMYYNNRPLYATEAFQETNRGREDDDDQNDWARYYFADSDSDLDTNLTYCNNNHPISVREEVEEAERRRDDDDYFPGIIAIRPGEYSSGTGQVFPEKFTPPNSSIRPQDLFPPSLRKNTTPPVRRFISRLNSNEMLIYTDGACLGNGQANPRAGCGVVFREERPGRMGHFAFALELQGPTGHPRPQTSNRAELRAVIAALQFRIWPGEGWTKIVIATDSEYVVEGATSWIKGWVRNGWRTSRGRPVKNKDLWKCLLGWCEAAAKEKTKLEFWRIPREWNAEADGWAKLAADEDVRPTTFIKPAGYLI